MVHMKVKQPVTSDTEALKQTQISPLFLYRCGQHAVLPDCLKMHLHDER